MKIDGGGVPYSHEELERQRRQKCEMAGAIQRGRFLEIPDKLEENRWGELENPERWVASWTRELEYSLKIALQEKCSARELDPLPLEEGNHYVAYGKE